MWLCVRACVLRLDARAASPARSPARAKKKIFFLSALQRSRAAAQNKAMSLVASAQRFAHALAQYEDELAARAKEVRCVARARAWLTHGGES